MAQATPTDLAPWTAAKARQDARDTAGGRPIEPALRGTTKPGGSPTTPGVVVVKGIGRGAID